LVLSLGLCSGQSNLGIRGIVLLLLLLLLLFFLLLLLLLDRRGDGDAVVKARRSNLETLTFIGPPDFRLLGLTGTCDRLLAEEDLEEPEKFAFIEPPSFRDPAILKVLVDDRLGRDGRVLDDNVGVRTGRVLVVSGGACRGGREEEEMLEVP
jgi:hypothetical protein